jgi:glutaminyl-tRNA synthetase
MEYKELINNFITDIIDQDIKMGKHSNIITRFPPEPNGYLHIGHAKSICLNFGLALKYNGSCNLRFDDTNPEKESKEYVDSIIEDVKWLGFEFDKKLLYASDYFDQMYDYAIQLIKLGKAYVDDQDAKEIKDSRGTLTRPGMNSSFRSRDVDENLKLFQNMKNGQYKDGEKVLRAKIDMLSPNMNMRDPILYRILHASHHRVGDKWCIYPMYDWAHGLEDSIENITHSICTLEFEDHRPLYDWFLKQLSIHHPQQIEFSRLNLEYTIMSKRHLKSLVDNNYVANWDDPRMPTISGLRRKGYPANAIKEFIYSLGIGKNDGYSSVEHLEYFVRKNLNQISNRVMAVLDPIKLIIDNYDQNSSEILEAKNNPEDENSGIRKIHFSKELYIEKDDFIEDAPEKYFRLTVGKEARLLHAYYVICTHIVRDHNGEIKEIHCTYDTDTKGGWSEDGRKVKGTIHWVSVQHSINAKVRVYEKLFTKMNPYDCKDGETFIDNLNQGSLNNINNVKLESSLENSSQNSYYQFVRKGYFKKDKDSSKKDLIFNQIVNLRDSWKKHTK